MKSTSHAPERIGLYGIEGAGKTKAIAETANYYRVTETPGTFHWITYEMGSLNRLSDGYENFWDNVIPYQFSDWMSLRTASDKALSAATENDWVILENSDQPWRLVRQLYDELHAKKEGIDLSDIFSMLPTDEDRGRWDRINPEYYKWFNPLWEESNPAHLLMTAPETDVKVPTGKPKEWKDDDTTLKLYQHHGKKPDAQKKFSPSMHTVLWLQRPGVGRWTMTSIKDRERVLLQDAEVSPDFVLSYLVPVAHWSL